MPIDAVVIGGSPWADSSIDSLACDLPDDVAEGIDSAINIGTMHLAKGLEFRAVAVISCDTEVIPLQSRVESIVDEVDLEDVYNTEQTLLFIASTCLWDHLLVTGVNDREIFC